MHRILIAICFSLISLGSFAQADITAMEYFFDDDPGYGSGTPIAISQASTIDININLSTAALSQGYHTLYVRAQDQNGEWGLVEKRAFIIQDVAGANPPAADINKVEYFIVNNVDPGSGTDVPVSTSGTIDENIVANTAALPVGTYTIYARARNTDNVWGLYETRTFLVADGVGGGSPPTPNVVDVEYFIGNDPGHGSGTSLAGSFSANTTIDFNDIIPQSLPDGYHTIYVRAQDANGIWGLKEARTFLIQQVAGGPPVISPVEELEYFFDNDPGVGSATPLGTFSAATTIDINEVITQALADGYHYINIRGRNQDGTWGLTERRPILIQQSGSGGPGPVSDITKIEYFFNDDPGLGNATEMTITPGPVIDIMSIDLPTSPTIPEGTNTITVRAQNALGEWGVGELREFDVMDDCTQPTASFTPFLACATEPVSFMDNSTDIQPDAQYRWYFDGDNIVDDNTVGSTSFTFAQPGSYDVGLAISQGQICYDSIGVTIIVKPLPVVVFSANNPVQGTVTNFTVSSANVDPGATWDWDFDGDGTIDDNTAGNTSHIYSASGSFTARLTVSDGAGCDVLATSRVTVAPEGSGGGGGGSPLANFTAAAICDGEVSIFTDLSQNIPTGSTYSWDFDSDGVEDDNTVGSTTFSYPAPGDYVTTLIINLNGGGTTQAIQTATVTDIPIADFDANVVCVGIATDFTDMSLDLDPSVAYAWDFDNDGIDDATTAGNVSFTYPSAGDFLAKLTVDNGNGCEEILVKQVKVLGMPTPQFINAQVCVGEQMTFTDQSTTLENGATYSWDFDGDGVEDDNVTGDASFTYTQVGTYDATLTIDNGVGCQTQFMLPVTVSNIPTAAFTLDARCFGQNSIITDMSTELSPGATYSWDFDGDGIEDSNTAGDQTFVYPTFQSYLARLTIDNGGGCVSTAEVLVNFKDAALPDFVASEACQSQEVIFTDLSTQLEVGAMYSWDFNGDGFEDSAFPGSTSWTYDQPGTYQATLTIDNGNSCLAVKTIEVEVTAPPALELGDDVLLCVEGTVTLDAGPGYSSYFWQDGSTEQTLTVDQIGDYWVAVTDAKGCINIDTIGVKLKGPPLADFGYQIELTTDGIMVHFQNQTVNGETYSWNFGDGGSSLDESPSHLYQDFFFYKPTVYEVCMQASNNCADSTVCQMILLSPTGADETEISTLTVFPNPSNNGFFQINFNLEKPQEIIIQVLDLQGRVIKNTKRQSDGAGVFEEIDLSKESKGVYLLRVIHEEGTENRKLIYE